MNATAITSRFITLPQQLLRGAVLILFASALCSMLLYTQGSRPRQSSALAASLADGHPAMAAEKESKEATHLKNLFSSRNQLTEVHYTLTEARPVTIKVFDLLGQEVQSLPEENPGEGEHITRWDGRNRQGHTMPSGLYIVQLKTGEETSSVRVLKY